MGDFDSVDWGTERAPCPYASGATIGGWVVSVLVVCRVLWTFRLMRFDPTTGAVPSTGCEWNGFFKSEFGCVSMSSFESLSAQLPGPEQWGIHAPSMFFRSWPVDCVLTAFFGEPQDGVGWNATGEAAFKKQLYLSQLGQALVQVRQIQEWRGNNVFGILFWMYVHRYDD